MSKSTQVRPGATAKIPSQGGDKVKIPNNSVGVQELKPRSVDASKMYNQDTQVKVADYQMLTSDALVIVNTGLGGIDVTVTLPDATTCNGQEFTVKKIESSTNPKYVKIGTLFGQTVDLQASLAFYLTAACDAITLKSDGANYKVVVWHRPPIYGFRYKGSNQTVANNSIVLAALNGGQGNQVSFISDGRIDILFDGLYDISANAQWVSNSAGSRAVLVYLNGQPFSGQSNKANDDGVTPCHTSFSMNSFFLAAGDFVQLFVYQSSGGNLDITSGIFGKPNFSLSVVRSSAPGGN